MLKDAYLSDAGAAARQRVTSDLLREVKTAIDRDGHWQDENEWRISTYLTRRIELVDAHDQRWFEVTVKSDNEMTCRAPTLEFMFVFERLVTDLFWTLGWPSWASRQEPAPQAGSTIP